MNKDIMFASDYDGTLTNQNIGDYIGDDPLANLKQVKKITLGFTPKKGIDVLFRMGLKPIIITGRHEVMRDVTEQWLRMYNVPYSELVMMSFKKFDWNEYVRFKIVEHKKRPIKFALEDKQFIATILNGVGVPTFLVTDDFEKTLKEAMEKKC